MSQHSFLLTYSVSPNGDGMAKEKAADKVRRDIGTMQFSDWNKLECRDNFRWKF
jgi:hypothetical protein